jgi:hypothetical protein
MDDHPPLPQPTRSTDVHASRWETFLYRMLLAWGFLLIAAIMVGVVGFLIHFFELQF